MCSWAVPLTESSTTVLASSAVRSMVSGSWATVRAGCELAGYASDITRTFPVGGRFSPEQREAVRSTPT